MNKVLTYRHSKSQETLFQAIKRVAQTVAKNERAYKAYVNVMINMQFLPAGRTLLTADPISKTVVPNCAVVPPHPRIYRKLMPLTIGLGSNLNNVKNVVCRMRELGSIPIFDATGRKPGIMQTLSWNHPEVLEFIYAKQNITKCDPLFNMNISLLVPRSEYAQFRSSPVFEHAINTALSCGDPGILFPHKTEQHSLATSPCGELWMNPYEVCTLGNINVSRFISSTGIIDRNGLSQVTKIGIQFLNDVLDTLVLPLPEMYTVNRQHKRIGLGIMGFATALKTANIAYGSKQSMQIAHTISKIMNKCAVQAKSTHASILAFAPTGGTAALLHTSFSVDPFFTEATSIPISKQIKMVSTWQKHVDNSISKTINLPDNALPKDAAKVFDLAHKHQLRGITIYKDKSRQHQPISCSTC